MKTCVVETYYLTDVSFAVVAWASTTIESAVHSQAHYRRPAQCHSARVDANDLNQAWNLLYV